MDLLLVRHAIAESAAPARRDDLRALTAKGVARFGRVVAALGRVGLRLDELQHSPLLRAVQTADLLAPLLDGERLETELLAAPPGAALLDALGGGCTALVGHEPWMSELLSLLLTGCDEHAERLAFKKGAVAWLRGRPEPAGMGLVALLPPRVLCDLAPPA